MRATVNIRTKDLKPGSSASHARIALTALRALRKRPKTTVLQSTLLLILLDFQRLLMHEHWVRIFSGTAHSDLLSENISLYPQDVILTKLNKYTAVFICTTKQPEWSFNLIGTLQCCSAMFQFLV